MGTLVMNPSCRLRMFLLQSNRLVFVLVAFINSLWHLRQTINAYYYNLNRIRGTPWILVQHRSRSSCVAFRSQFPQQNYLMYTTFVFVSTATVMSYPSNVRFLNSAHYVQRKKKQNLHRLVPTESIPNSVLCSKNKLLVTYSKTT